MLAQVTAEQIESQNSLARRRMATGESIPDRFEQFKREQPALFEETAKQIDFLLFCVASGTMPLQNGIMAVALGVWESLQNAQEIAELETV